MVNAIAGLNCQANVDPACVIQKYISDADGDDGDNENFDVYCFAGMVASMLWATDFELPITHDVLIED